MRNCQTQTYLPQRVQKISHDTIKNKLMNYIHNNSGLKYLLR